MHMWQCINEVYPFTPAASFFATQLGMATVASSLGPDEALLVFSELQKARRAFVLQNELHIIYQVRKGCVGGIRT